MMLKDLCWTYCSIMAFEIRQSDICRRCIGSWTKTSTEKKKRGKERYIGHDRVVHTQKFSKK